MFVSIKNNTTYIACREELLNLPEYLCSPPGVSGVSVARSIVFYVLFCRALFVLYILCPSIYGFWLPTLVSPSLTFLLKSSPFWILKCAVIYSLESNQYHHVFHYVLSMIFIIVLNLCLTNQLKWTGRWYLMFQF